MQKVKTYVGRSSGFRKAIASPENSLDRFATTSERTLPDLLVKEKPAT